MEQKYLWFSIEEMSKLIIPIVILFATVALGYIVRKVLFDKISRLAKNTETQFEPFIRYNGFDDSSVNFTVIMRAKEFVDQYLIKHEFIKRAHEKYKKEGIIIPYPIRAINYSQEKREIPTRT